MSLTEPTRAEQFIAFFRTDSRRKIVLWAVLALVALGGLLYVADRVTGWRDRSTIDRKRQEINTALSNLANVQDRLQRDRTDEAVAAREVIRRTEDYVNAVNATDAARVETNRALQNLNAAVNAGRNAGIVANDLEKRLKEVSP